MSVPKSYGEDAANLKVLATSALFIRVTELVMHFRIYLHFSQNPTERAISTGENRASNYCRNHMFLIFLASSGWLLLILDVIPADKALWVFGLDYVTSHFFQILFMVTMLFIKPLGLHGCAHAIMKRGKKDSLPFFIEHYSERIGCLVIIVLGETIDGIAVHANGSTEGSSSLYVTIFLAFILVFFIKLLYFDCQIVNVDCHALRIGGRNAAIWNTVQPFLALGVAITGDALAVLAEKQTGDGPEITTGEEPEVTRVT